MNKDFQKWLCELAEVEYNLYSGCDNADECNGDECLAYKVGAENDGCYIKNITIKILIKAMWAINKERKYNIKMDYNKIVIYSVGLIKNNTDIKYFHYKTYNNSEQETLEAALEYIYNKEK